MIFLPLPNERTASDWGVFRRGARRWVWRVVMLLPLLAVPAPAAAITAQQPPTDEQYQQARDLTLRGEWEKALPLFRVLSQVATPMASEAAFYVGFCLENISGHDREAFSAYEQVRTRFPGTPAAERALLRQITLAGMLGSTDPQHREFLARHTTNDEPRVRREAALSLARLADERAIPGLEEILREGNLDQKLVALERSTQYRPEVTTRLVNQVTARPVEGAADEELRRQAQRIEQNITRNEADQKRTLTLLSTDMQALMEAMKRQGEEWTEDELITHGLFHIMPRRTFVPYLQADTAGQERIYHEFFEELGDPVPQTPDRNELEEEFRRRVHEAFRKYSEPWRGVRSRYDVREWLTPDTPYTPWDSRGELLIRYGEPDDIFLVGHNIEEWYYGLLRVDFTVALYRANFYLNAIFPGRASQQDHPAGYVQAHYISRPRIEYWPTGRRR